MPGRIQSFSKENTSIIYTKIWQISMGVHAKFQLLCFLRVCFIMDVRNALAVEQRTASAFLTSASSSWGMTAMLPIWAISIPRRGLSRLHTPRAVHVGLSEGAAIQMPHSREETRWASMNMTRHRRGNHTYPRRV
jgi:hypothetical protein